MNSKINQMRYSLVFLFFISGINTLFSQDDGISFIQKSTTENMFFESFINQNDSAQGLQQNQDQKEIIKQCLTLKSLQDKMPAQVKDQMDQYYILDHGLEFYLSSDFKISNKKVRLIGKQEISALRPYFLFHTLNIQNKKAFVRYYFVYTLKGVETTIPITIDLEKRNSLWQVTNYTL
jgi:hypothetical protein